MPLHRPLLIVAILMTLLAPALARAQPVVAETADEQKRIFGIIPNYRTVPTMKDYEAINTSQKFKIARDDAFDRGTFVLAGLFGAEGQVMASTPAFGTGVSAYAKYSSASLADWMIGDFMTEGVYPALLHQDPRYFRKAEGGKWPRLRYAVGQIVLTHGDGGAMQFNLSEIAGNATAVGIANAYYPGNHSLSAQLSKLAIQLAVDAAANVVKEFAPDLTR